MMALLYFLVGFLIGLTTRRLIIRWRRKRSGLTYQGGLSASYVARRNNKILKGPL